MILKLAIALVLQTYPDVKCGDYACGAYDICERESVRTEACSVVLEGEDDE